jgi:hypothetical protein
MAVSIKFDPGNTLFFMMVFFHPGFNLTKKLGKKSSPEGR